MSPSPTINTFLISVRGGIYPLSPVGGRNGSHTSETDTGCQTHSVRLRKPEASAMCRRISPGERRCFIQKPYIHCWADGCSRREPQQSKSDQSFDLTRLGARATLDN